MILIKAFFKCSHHTEADGEERKSCQITAYPPFLLSSEIYPCEITKDPEIGEFACFSKAFLDFQTKLRNWLQKHCLPTVGMFEHKNMEFHREYLLEIDPWEAPDVDEPTGEPKYGTYSSRPISAEKKEKENSDDETEDNGTSLIPDLDEK